MDTKTGVIWFSPLLLHADKKVAILITMAKISSVALCLKIHLKNFSCMKNNLKIFLTTRNLELKICEPWQLEKLSQHFPAEAFYLTCT